jgi:hypothetical protein
MKRLFTRGCRLVRIPSPRILVLFLGGCSAFTGYPPNYQDTSAVLAADTPFLSADVRAKGNAPSDAERGGLTQEQYRDTVAYSRMEVIDINYYDFEAKLTGTYNLLDVGADFTTLILSGLGATTGAAATKAALAAASAGVIGANAAVNTDLFYKKTLPALVAQMRAGRQTMLVAIKYGLTNPVSKYSLDQALNDINSYYVAGTLPSAVSQVTSQAGAAIATANDQLDKLRSVKYVAPSAGSTAAQILAWLYPNGDERKPVNVTNLKKLTSWMENDKIDPILNNIPYQNLLTGGGLTNAESDRQRAIQALNIPKVAP